MSVFDRGMAPNEWGIPRRSPSEPPRGYDWRRAVDPGPLNGRLYIPRREEIVYVGRWAGRDAYPPYEDAPHLIRRRYPDEPDPPFLFLVTDFEALQRSQFAWLTGWRCTPALRVPEGDKYRIWVRMTEVISTARAEALGLLTA